MPDGTSRQRCAACAIPKDYTEFHKAASRWNGIASQCKECKNSQRRGSYRSAASPKSLARRRQLDDEADLRGLEESYAG